MMAMAVAPAVVMAPVPAVMPPMAAMVMAMAPMARMVAMAKMVVMPLHGFDGRVRGERGGRRGLKRSGLSGAATDQPAGHEGERGEREAGPTRRG